MHDYIVNYIVDYSMILVSFPSCKCSLSEYLHVLTTLHMN